MSLGRTRLFLHAIIKVLLGVVALLLLLFLPAGTFYYRGAWLLLALLFIPMLVMGTVLLFKAPDLLRRRLDTKEKRKAQRGVIKYSGLLFVCGFIVAALDFRYGWTHVSDTFVGIAAVIFLVGYGLYAETIRENEWLSRTVKVEAGQKVVTTGLYGIVRHPMYTATLLMFLSMPLILGSWWSFVIFLLYIPIIISRILDEEKLLLNDLPGYADYCRQLPWRLLPLLW